MDRSRRGLLAILGALALLTCAVAGQLIGGALAHPAPIVPAVRPIAGATYAIGFTETGLPSGTRWYVNLTGEPSASSTSASIGFTLPNGTYSFAVASSRSDWLPDPGSGMLHVIGTVGTNSLVFYRVYALTIDRPTGVPSGGSWSATLGGTLVFSAGGVPGTQTTETTTAPTLVVYGPNGTYHYTVKVASKSSYNDTNSVTIHGAPATVVPLSAYGPRNSDLLWYVLAVAAVVVAAGGIAALLLRRRPPRTEETASMSQGDPPPTGEDGSAPDEETPGSA